MKIYIYFGVHTTAMGFTSDSRWFLLIKTLLIKNNKKGEAALKTEAGGDEKHVSLLLGLIVCPTMWSLVISIANKRPHHETND